MKKIIVPIDFSIHSENALKTAVNIANENTEIIVVHMLGFEEHLTTLSENQINESIVFYLKLAEKKLRYFLSKDYLQKAHITPVIKRYKVFSDLNKLAKEESAELIIMGSKGTTNNFEEFFVGSNTEKVVRNSEVPVLVIKDKPLQRISNAIFAYDFFEENGEVFSKVNSFLSKFDCNTKLVYVNTPNENFKSTTELEITASNFMRQQTQNTSCINDVAFVCDYSIEKGIFNFAKNHDSDLIVMTTHGRKGILNVLSGSISEDIANHSSLPVLTFKL